MGQHGLSAADLWRARLFPSAEIPDAQISYTPIAALGLIESIHWKPAIRWRVSAVHVLEPVQLAEVSAPYPLLALKRPRWAVDFDFEMTRCAGPRDSIEVHREMFLRKARRLPSVFGYLGKYEFPASVRLHRDAEKLETRLDVDRIHDFGWLPFKRRIEDPRTFHFFRALADGGVIHVPAELSNGHSPFQVKHLGNQEPFEMARSAALVAVG